jgi:hypothetical protein
MSKQNGRKLIVLGVLAGLMSGAQYAGAQWGTNAPPCPSHCAPASPWWGYVQTRWTRWPGATYPDMLKAPGTAGEGIPGPSVDLPQPNKESEIRSAPSSDNTKAPEPAPNASETQTDSSTEPTPAKPFSPPKPMDMPSVKEAPGAAAPTEEPLFTTPSTPPSPAEPSTPPNPMEPSPITPPANSGSNFQPKTRLRAVQAKFDAASASGNDWSVQRDSKTETAVVATAKPLRLRIDADDFSRPLSSEQASAAASSVGHSVGHTVAATGQVSVASGNPLRLEVAPTNGSEEAPLPSGDNRAGSAYSSDATSYSTPAAYQR